MQVLIKLPNFRWQKTGKFLSHCPDVTKRSTTKQRVLWLKPKLKNKFQSSENYSIVKTLLKTRRNQFWKHCRRFPARNTKPIENQTPLKKSSFPDDIPQGGKNQLWYTRQFFPATRRSFSPESRIDVKKLYFLWKIISPKRFEGTQWMQFQQSCRRV